MPARHKLSRGISAVAPRRTVGARVRGRSERVVRAVLHAALVEVARVGYGGLRLEDVAAKAEVAKTTIYRRWPTKASLVSSAIETLARYDAPLPDTGSLRNDLLDLVEQTLERVSTPIGFAVARLVMVENSEHDVERLCRDLKKRGLRHRARVIVRAKKRGDLPKAADPMLILEFLFGVVITRVIRGEKIDGIGRQRLVDFVVTSAEHGGAQRRQPRRSSVHAGTPAD